MLSISKDHLLSRLLHIGNLFCTGTPEQGSLGSLRVPLNFFWTHKVETTHFTGFTNINYKAPLAKKYSCIPVVMFIYSLLHQMLRECLRQQLRWMRQNHWYWLQRFVIQRKTLARGLFCLLQMSHIFSWQAIWFQSRSDLLWALLRCSVCHALWWMWRCFQSR